MSQDLAATLGTTSRRPTWSLLAPWALLALLWFGSLGWRALITPDEGRYATIALEMLRTGDWLTPHLNGFLYFEKPALQYWISAASLGILGVNEFAARFWPGVSGFLTILTVAATARRLWNEEAGIYAGAVAAGTAWIVANSHFLTLDMGLTLFLTLALCGFLLAQREGIGPGQQRNAMWLCWAAMAGAMLSKGLVGLVIPGATLVLYSLVQREFAFWRRMHWLSGLAIFLALAAPWFIAVSLKNPGFFDFFFIREHFQRFLTDEAQRPGPLYYFVPILLAGLLPWTTLLPGMVKLGIRGEQGAAFQPLRLLLIWSGFVFVFFSVSHSKLPSYILPMFPALALVAARQLVLMDAPRLKRHLLLPALLWAVAMVAAPVAVRMHPRGVPVEILAPFAKAIAIAAVLFLLSAGLAWRLLGQDRKRAAILALAFGSVTAVTATMLGHDAYGRQLKSSEAVVRQLAPYLRADTEVFAVRFYDQSLPFYLGRPVTLVDFRGEFAFGEDAQPSRWLPTLEDFAGRWRAQPRAAAMMSPATYRELEQMQLPMRVAYRDPDRLVVVKPEGAQP
jgi:4-amino-4-deoxy-L-arabinose transferase-like glycosyltransferase